MSVRFTLYTPSVFPFPSSLGVGGGTRACSHSESIAFQSLVNAASCSSESTHAQRARVRYHSVRIPIVVVAIPLQSRIDPDPIPLEGDACYV